MATINVKDAGGATVALEKPLIPGQAAMAASRPVVIASDQSALPIATHAVTQSGTWTVQPGNTANTTPWIAKVSDGTNAAAIKAASTAPIATDPSLVVALSPNGLNANGRTTPANSAPVVAASQTYETVAASQTAQILGGAGATGDYIDSILVIPATTSPGNVLLIDNATSITVFTGGATSVSNLVPFTIQLGMVSASGAWKITTGANVSAIGIGNFT